MTSADKWRDENASVAIYMACGRREFFAADAERAAMMLPARALPRAILDKPPKMQDYVPRHGSHTRFSRRRSLTPFRPPLDIYNGLPRLVSFSPLTATLA